MKKLKRDNPELDYIKQFSTRSVAKGLQKYSSEVFREHGLEVAAALVESTNAEHRVKGIQAEYMFEAIVAGLGRVKLLKAEDAGDAYFTGAELAIPDYRVVLADGKQLLVEVKLHREAIGKPFKLSDARMQCLIRYSELVGAELRFAICWEEHGRWTLNSLKSFRAGEPGKKWSVGFPRAMATSDMMDLGDYTISIPSPLTFRVMFDLDGSEPFDKDGRALLKVEDVHLVSQGKRLTGLSAQIASILLWYGGWEEQEQESIAVGGKLRQIDYPLADPGDDEEFDEERPRYPMMGPLSTVLTRAYLASSEETIQPGILPAVLKPGFMGTEFIPENWVDLKLDLHIAKFFMQPNFDFPHGDE